ncbi:hypothetical protein Tco_0295612 [Tanacetum coccineum]
MDFSFSSSTSTYLLRCAKLVDAILLRASAFLFSLRGSLRPFVLRSGDRLLTLLVIHAPVSAIQVRYSPCCEQSPLAAGIVLRLWLCHGLVRDSSSENGLTKVYWSGFALLSVKQTATDCSLAEAMYSLVLLGSLSAVQRWDLGAMRGHSSDFSALTLTVVVLKLAILHLAYVVLYASRRWQLRTALFNWNMLSTIGAYFIALRDSIPAFRRCASLRIFNVLFRNVFAGSSTLYPAGSRRSIKFCLSKAHSSLRPFSVNVDPMAIVCSGDNHEVSSNAEVGLFRCQYFYCKIYCPIGPDGLSAEFDEVAENLSGISVSALIGFIILFEIVVWSSF